MKIGMRKLCFVLSVIICGLVAVFVLALISLTVAHIPDLNYPLTVVVPLAFCLVLYMLLILFPSILYRCWKQQPCKSWWKAFWILLCVFILLVAIAKPINIVIQKNNILFVPHEEKTAHKSGDTTANQTTEQDIKLECVHELEETIVREATAEQKGEKQIVCKNCGYSYSEEIPKLEFALTEIFFRGLPWGVTSKDAKQMLETANSTIDAYMLKESSIDYPEAVLERSFLNGINEGGNIIYAEKLTAGGYDIELAKLYFSYTVQDGKINRDTDYFYAALYCFDVVEHEAVYVDLQAKMTGLYGNGMESSKTESGWMLSGDYSGEYEYVVKQTTWYGENNTFVTLQWVSSTNHAEPVQVECGISMAYGKTNAKSMLDSLKQALKQEKAEADKENAEGNVDGL